jgi:3-hydroxyisobutyrate dehydrogenase-like beta-hydroxyacid dehydrogenase
MADNAHVAFIGLGTMGYPMAGHLQKAGFPTTVYNRSTAKAECWVEQYEGQMALTPQQAVVRADVVLCCVGNDEDVRALMLGPHGVMAGVQRGAVIVDHTTTSAHLPREMARLFAEQGNGFIDAPVSGGQAGAEHARLTIMCGGDKASFEKALPVLECYGHCVKHLGDIGNGQLAKMVNQICVAGVVQGLAEGMHFAEQAGLDVAEVIEVISKGAAQSWQMENRYQTMLAKDYDHGFAVDWMRKDLDYVLEEALSNGSQLPLTEMVKEFYAELQAMGGGRWDTSSLLARLQQQRKN